MQIDRHPKRQAPQGKGHHAVAQGYPPQGRYLEEAPVRRQGCPRGRDGWGCRRLRPDLTQLENQPGHGQPRQPRQQKGRTPAPGVGAHELAHHIGQGGAQGQGQVEQAQGPGSAAQRQEVRQVSRGQGAERGLSHPHQPPGCHQEGVGGHPVGQAGGQAPQHRPAGHEAETAPAVPQVAE